MLYRVNQQCYCLVLKPSCINNNIYVGQMTDDLDVSQTEHRINSSAPTSAPGWLLPCPLIWPLTPTSSGWRWRAVAGWPWPWLLQGTVPVLAWPLVTVPLPHCLSWSVTRLSSFTLLQAHTFFVTCKVLCLPTRKEHARKIFLDLNIIVLQYKFIATFKHMPSNQTVAYLTKITKLFSLLIADMINCLSN